MVDFNGFDKGVIGKKLPSDATLNNMRKADLIELLHLAESNHRVLSETYKIAIDTSKCNHCPLSIDTRRVKQIRAEIIDEYQKALHEKFESNKALYGTNHSEYWNLSMNDIDEVTEKLKERVDEVTIV